MRENIDSLIKIRYSQEANSCDNTLSCGNNLRFADLKNSEKVLDLGCGRGKETIAAALAVLPDGQAVGLDLTSSMIEAAEENARQAKVDNIKFVLGEIEALPFEDQTFDVVISNCVINHSRNKLKVYQEIYRILKPNGRLIISDIVALEEIPPEVKNDAQAWANCFAGAENKDVYFRMIAEAGFTSIDILSMREYKKEGYLIASVTFQANREVRS